MGEFEADNEEQNFRAIRHAHQCGANYVQRRLSLAALLRGQMMLMRRGQPITCPTAIASRQTRPVRTSIVMTVMGITDRVVEPLVDGMLNRVRGCDGEQHRHRNA